MRGGRGLGTRLGSPVLCTWSGSFSRLALVSQATAPRDRPWRGAEWVGSSAQRLSPGGCSPPVLPGDHGPGARLGSQWGKKVSGWGRLLRAGTEPPLSKASAFHQASPLPTAEVAPRSPSSPLPMGEANGVAWRLVAGEAGRLVPLAFGGWGSGREDASLSHPCTHPPHVSRRILRAGDPA